MPTATVSRTQVSSATVVFDYGLRENGPVGWSVLRTTRVFEEAVYSLEVAYAASDVFEGLRPEIGARVRPSGPNWLRESLIVERLRLESPLEIALALPAVLATVQFFGAFMSVIKRAYNLDVEIQAEREQLRTAVLREQVEQEKLSEELASLAAAVVHNRGHHEVQLRRIALQLQED